MFPPFPGLPVKSNRSNLPQIDRRDSPATALSTLSLVKHFSTTTSPNGTHRHKVVGLDLCGDPSVPLSPSLSPVFHSYQSFRRDNPSLPLGLTLHFGEAESSGSDAELDELLAWAPDRLGHVICVSERVKGVIRSQKSKGMGLELCLSCNVHAGMVCGGFEGQYVFFFFSFLFFPSLLFSSFPFLSFLFSYFFPSPFFHPASTCSCWLVRD